MLVYQRTTLPDAPEYVKLVTFCVVPLVKIKYVLAEFVSVPKVLLPVMVNGLVVPPVEDTVPNV